jgi:hypothetical protein
LTANPDDIIEKRLDTRLCGRRTFGDTEDVVGFESCWIQTGD